MEPNYLCFTCDNPADLLCMCARVSICKTCTGSHITRSPELVHTFLPITADKALKSGVDQFTVIRRAFISSEYKLLIKNEIEAIEHYKQESLSAIHVKADILTAGLSQQVGEKIEKLLRDVEIAKTASISFAGLIGREKYNVSNYEANVFLQNVLRRNINSEKLAFFKSTIEEAQCEEKLAEFWTFQLTYPTKQLFELTRTSEEYEEIKAKQKEHVLTRIVDGDSSWSVGGPPTVDAISFSVDKDICMTGLGMGTSYSAGGTAQIQNIEIRAGGGTRGDMLYSHPEIVGNSWDGSQENRYFKVPFKTPVKITKNTVYTIRTQYSQGGTIHAKSGGTIHNSVDEFTFNFTTTRFEGGDNDNSSSSTAGPIRDIYFTKAI